MEQNKFKYGLLEEISIARGTFYGCLGVICRVGFLFFVSLFLARELGPKDYGIWSLSFIILSFANTLVLLGLERALGRFIGKYRGRGEKEKIILITSTGVFLTLFCSLFISFLLFVFSSNIADVFKTKELSFLLKIMSFVLIPTALLEIIGSIFQGYENIMISRIINSFIPSFFWLVSITLLGILGAINLFNVSIFYIVSLWAAGGVGIYLLKKFLPIERTSRFSFLRISPSYIKNHAGPLLNFSLPLLLFNFLVLASAYADSLIIGYFLGPRKVGIYNIAFRIARLSPFLLLGSMDVFIPNMSKNIAQEKSKEIINKLYLRVTKWSFAITLLVILTLMMFSDFFLSWFGEDYVEGSFALKLLLVAYLIYSLIGPTEGMNIAIGSSRFVAGYTLLGALTSVILCWILVPLLGIEGAALVSIITMLLTKAVAFLKLKIVDGLNIFYKEYVIFIILAISMGAGIGFVINTFINSNIYGVILFGLIFGFFELLILKRLRLIDEKDISIRNKIFQNFFNYSNEK